MKSVRRATLDDVARLVDASLAAPRLRFRCRPGRASDIGQGAAGGRSPKRKIDVVRAIVERGVDAIVFVGTDRFWLNV